MKNLVVILLAALFMAGCFLESSSGVEEVVLERFNDEGVRYSPGSYRGKVKFSLPYRTVKKAKIVSLDYGLTPKDTFDAEIGGYGNSISVSFSNKELGSPYVEVHLFVDMEKSSKLMEFTHYVDITNEDDPELNLLSAISAERIERLYKESKGRLKDVRRDVLEEMEKVFALNGKLYNPSLFSALKNQADDNVYLYCLWEAPDSVFYDEFKKLRHYLRNHDRLSDSIKIRIADEIYDLSRQGSLRYKDPEMAFYQAGYQLPLDTLLNPHKGSVVFIDAKEGKFYGETWIYDEGWRTVSSLEKSIGVCYKLDVSYAQADGKYYKCNVGSSTWMEIGVSEWLTTAKGKCERNTERIRSSNGVDYLCHNETWMDSFTKSDLTYWASLEEAEIENRATTEFGPCSMDLFPDNKRILEDSIFVGCTEMQTKVSNTRWTVWHRISYEEYYLPSSGKEDEYAELPDGRFYVRTKTNGCLPVLNCWQEILAPQYYNHSCMGANPGEIVHYEVNGGDQYFLCEAFGLTMGSYGKWRRIPDEDVLPPVKDEQTCFLLYTLKKYDDIFYVCLEDGDTRNWKVAPDSLVMPPDSIGHFCTNSIQDSVEKFGDDYYVCRNRRWRKMSAEEIVNGIPCTSKTRDVLELQDGVYYLCTSRGWRETEENEVLEGARCFDQVVDDVNKLDDVYYVCDGRNMRWRALNENEVIDGKVCNYGNQSVKEQIISKGSDFYMCDYRNGWRKMDADEFIDGLACVAVNVDSVRQLNDDYYVCDGRNYKWRILEDVEIKNGVACNHGNFRMNGKEIIVDGVHYKCDYQLGWREMTAD